MFEGGSSLTVKGLSLCQQVDLHSHSDTFPLGYWWGCMASQHLQPIRLLVAGPQVAWRGTAWVARLGTQLRVDAHWKELPVVSTMPLRLLSWQIPSGKEEQAGFLLPAFNASVVTESSACGLAVMLPLGRLYLMFLFFKMLFYIQLLCGMLQFYDWCNVCEPDFPACVTYKKVLENSSCDIATLAIKSVLLKYFL